MIAQALSTLPPNLDCYRLPQHIAIIMDGNGRWANQRGLPRIAGHRRGALMLKDLLRCCKDWGIAMLTVYAFSTENWGRPLPEIDFLMRLFERLLRQELKEMQEQGVKIQFIGDCSGLPLSLQQQMQQAAAQTQHNQHIYLNVAINYGGRQEIIRACRHLAQQIQTGQLEPEGIDECLFEQSLDTAGIPSPDLLIRTSGEMRLSNFLLWQMAYTEIYVTDTQWPDFDREAFYQALMAYQSRNRRFGKL